MYQNKVCILTTVHPTFEGRIFHRLAKTLVNAGYDVTQIATHYKSEVVDGVKIVPLTAGKSRIARVLGTFRALILALKVKADIYHLHDPELMPIGILLKIITKKIIIFDCHEDVQQQILDKEWIGNHFNRKMVSEIYKLIEKFSVMFFDAVIAATPYIADKFDKKKTIAIRNLPILKLIDNCQISQLKKEKKIVIYAGVLSKIRGIEEIINAMEYIGDMAELWIIGRWENEQLRKKCEKCNGWKYTKYFGYLKIENVYSLMKNADIGLHLVYGIKRYLVGLPTKVFEYMACSLPAIVTESEYWQEIFNKNSLFADPYNPKDIAQKVTILLENNDKRKKMGNEGRILVEKIYSWEKESERLLNFYNSLTNKNEIEYD
jgi:glycosyltransferase involved in cell wall biosynthesis